MDWEDVIPRLDAWVVKTAAPCWDVKQAAASIFTKYPVDYFYSPDRDQVALFPRTSIDFHRPDALRCKRAAERAVGADHVRETYLTRDEATGGDWVKVAYSETLRRAGELLNFFPGTYPGGIPNAPSPLAAMLTTGLVGGGLGYGVGSLAEALMPHKYGKKLKRTGAILGALAGAAPGAAWAYANHATGHSLLDPHPLDTPPIEQLSDSPKFDRPSLLESRLAGTSRPQTEEYSQEFSNKHLLAPQVGDAYKGACDSFVKRAFGDMFGGGDHRHRTPYDVNINALGQTLWESGASPDLAATTMGAMYAAQQLPDERSSPGHVTGGQLGQLAMNAGKDYLTGAWVGAVLNQVVGTPYTFSQIGKGVAALGLIGSVVPKLFH